jgi:transposase
VLVDRKKETVAAFLRAIPAALRRTIERACTDMYEGFVNAMKEEIPWAEVVIDRFHVARAYRDCADMVRKKELKRLNSTLLTFPLHDPDQYSCGLHGKVP